MSDRTVVNAEKLSVTQLRHELQMRDVPAEGERDELVNRLNGFTNVAALSVVQVREQLDYYGIISTGTKKVLTKRLLDYYYGRANIKHFTKQGLQYRNIDYLRQHCREIGLNLKGKKSALVKRLWKKLHGDTPSPAQKSQKTSTSSTSSTSSSSSRSSPKYSSNIIKKVSKFRTPQKKISSNTQIQAHATISTSTSPKKNSKNKSSPKPSNETTKAPSSSQNKSMTTRAQKKRKRSEVAPRAPHVGKNGRRKTSSVPCAVIARRGTKRTKSKRGTRLSSRHHILSDDEDFFATLSDDEFFAPDVPSSERCEFTDCAACGKTMNFQFGNLKLCHLCCNYMHSPCCSICTACEETFCGKCADFFSCDVCNGLNLCQKCINVNFLNLHNDRCPMKKRVKKTR